jgi:hypothetical protein
MGVRAYLLVEVADDMEQQDFITTLRQMEELRIVSMFERHRASKQELLKALSRSGVQTTTNA